MTDEALRACLQPLGPLRPTFCNIPTWGQILVYAMGLLAMAIFAYGVYRHWRAWRAGQAQVPARNEVWRRERIGILFRYVLGQRATIARRVPAVFHTSIFWGFLFLFAGTALATIDWDVLHLFFDKRLLYGWFYVGYEFALDTAGAVFLVGLLIAIWRRYIVAPHHVLGAWDFVIWSLVIVNVTGFLVEGFRLSIAPVDWGGASWLGQGIANLVLGWGSETFVRETLPTVHFWVWWAHGLAALLFVAAVPYTNAVHMLSTAANATLQSLDAIGTGAALQPVDIENAEFFGVGRLNEFNWKQRLGFDACVRCGRCETVCPAYMSGTPLNPKAVVVSLSAGVRQAVDPPPPDPASAQVEGAPNGLLVGEGKVVEPDVLWACTTCMACVQACPAFIEILDDLVDMRRYLTLTEGVLPGTAGASLRNMGTSGNPWGYAPEDRLAWAEGLDVQVAQPGKHYELLYWVGCSGAYDQRSQKISRSIAALLQRARVDFAVMREERCHCESARRLGEEYLYQTAAEENIASLASYTFDRIMCHCPHCYNTLRNEYPQFGADYEVVHHTEVLEELVRAGRLPGMSPSTGRVAFHDSCYLGRYNGLFDAPRAVLDASGVETVELERRREDGLCCGGGGGKMWFEDAEFERKVEEIRMEEALAAQPDVVGVACPFCLTMLDGAAKTLGAEGVAVLDVAEILERAVADSGANDTTTNGA